MDQATGAATIIGMTRAYYAENPLRWTKGAYDTGRHQCLVGGIRKMGSTFDQRMYESAMRFVGAAIARHVRNDPRYARYIQRECGCGDCQTMQMYGPGIEMYGPGIEPWNDDDRTRFEDVMQVLAVAEQLARNAIGQETRVVCVPTMQPLVGKVIGINDLPMTTTMPIEATLVYVMDSMTEKVEELLDEALEPVPA